MSIKSVAVYNFRSHDEYKIPLSPQTTIITGKNGSGKTSLIEALYIALRGSSFRGSDVDILKHTKDWYRVDVELQDGLKRSVVFNPLKPSGKKQFTINQTKHYRLPNKDKYPIVLFEPDDLRLLSGSPVRRRQFIDRFISQVDPHFHQAVRKYERALKQRNNLLKKIHTTQDELFVWNIALSEYGSYIISERIAFIERIHHLLSKTYNSITNSDEIVSIHYSHTLIGDLKQKLLNELIVHTDKDKITGFTSVGPHRHDIIFKLNNTLASTTASRGENRSVVLALKFIEVELIELLLDKKPLILLDDVFSELDEVRQKNILKSSYQTIITSTKLSREDEIQNVKHIPLS